MQNLNLREKFNLALQNHKKNNLKFAKTLYEEILISDPNYIDAYNNLGILFNQLGKHEEAISCYEKAIQIQPNNAAVYNNLGLLNGKLGKHEEAISYYEKAIQIQPNNAVAYYNLANTFKQLGKHEEAISYYEKAIQIQPNYVDAHNNLGILFNKLGKHEEAISCYEKAIQIQPTNLTSHWLCMNTFPIIYKNFEEINLFNHKFKKKIKKINKLLDLKSNYLKKDALSALNSSTNFFLHYQGNNVLELQRHYAQLIERITENIYGNIYKDKKKDTTLKHINIGFVSSFFRNHTVSKLFKNWILKINTKYFKRFVYYIDNKFDNITNEIKKNVDNFFSHNDVDKVINKISQDQIDVLIYLDIGMKPEIQVLSSLRLAPIQCNTWGHPITSGFKNIDYYFSSELMEEENSQKHYSEKLVKLPGLGISYDFPSMSNIKKLAFTKQLDKIIFFNLQNLIKLLPQDDHIYFDIIKKFPNCCFWFIEGANNSITSIFKKRIAKLGQKEGFLFEKYFYFHPRCIQDEFYGLIEASDIVLDSCNWSGGNTSLDAISLNKPIVTLPTHFMRGRHTYGILKILNINETIATSKKEYIEIAVKLASDINFRNTIINKIKSNKNNLFNNDEPIIFLEKVIRKFFSI